MLQAPQSHEISISEKILDSSPAGIVTVDEDENIYYHNQAFLALSGYRDREVANMSATQVFPEWKHLFANGHDASILTRLTGTYLKKRNGEQLSVKMYFRHFELKKKKLTTLYLFLIQTEDNQLVKSNPAGKDAANCYLELERTTNVLEFVNQQLEDSLASRRTFFDNAGVILFSADHEGVFQIFNLEAEKNLGYTKEEVIQKEKIDLLFCNDSMQQIKKQHPHLNTQTDNIAILRYLADNNHLKEKELVLRRKTGTEFSALLTITPIYNKHQRFIGYMGVASDITERKNIEKKLLDALEKEKQLGEMKTRFVTIASHEFRTPLSTILSSAYLTGRYHKSEDQYKRDRHLNRIISAVNTLSDMLNDFLNLGKIEEGKITMKVSEFDVKETFSMVIHDIKTNAKKGQTFFYQHFGDDKVATDPSLIRNILLNLISNAIKFSPENGVINIRSFVDSHQMTFHVEDNGIGISKEDKNSLSEKFFRGSNASHIQGTGLGLHIVSKYVERLKGKLECHSEINRGTVFKITLPVKKSNTYQTAKSNT